MEENCKRAWQAPPAGRPEGRLYAAEKGGIR